MPVITQPLQDFLFLEELSRFACLRAALTDINIAKADLYITKLDSRHDDTLPIVRARQMTMEPKPYLEYLDKEMTIMALLSAFSVALASFTTERIVSAERGFLHDLWLAGRDHVVAGAAAAMLAAFFFYLQRSHLAWYYGQIALAQSRGTSSPEPVEEWLTWADGWDTWVRYQGGFILLTLSFAYYAYAVGQSLAPRLRSMPRLWSLWLPLLIALIIVAVRWYVLSRYPQEDRPFAAWWCALRNACNSAVQRFGTRGARPGS
jgi:hypothetical protein